MTKPTGHVIWAGPSLLDGHQIVAIALHRSSNRKTGDMVQTYILCADIDPREANKTGADFSICGNCVHRGEPTTLREKKLALKRTCYVRIDQGPLIVWRAYQRGNYPTAKTDTDRAMIGAGRVVRLGTYGDPAAVPARVWRDLTMFSTGHTGYTHQSASACNLLMQSADSLPEAQAAWRSGLRTFRIVNKIGDLEPNETLCPASAEAGHKTTCAKCKLCAGALVNAKSIAIVAHGSGAKHFQGD